MDNEKTSGRFHPGRTWSHPPRGGLGLPHRMKTTAEAELDTRREVGRLLNLLLADEYMLYKITRDYHWNVMGADYHSLRLQFQIQHEEAARLVDDVAEKVRGLELGTHISWKDLMETARCSAPAGLGLPSQRMLVELLRAHDEIITQLSADAKVCLYYLGDADTAAFLGDLRERHENAAWMLLAQLGNSVDHRLSAPSQDD